MVITIFNSQPLNWSFFQVVVVHPSWSYEYVHSFHLTQIIDYLKSTWPNHVSLTVWRVIIAGLLKMNPNQFLVLESKLVLQSKLFLKVCEVLLCTALPVKYCSVFLIAYPRIRPRSSYASMLACLGGVLYKWNSKKGNHINDITDFLLPNVRFFFFFPQKNVPSYSRPTIPSLFTWEESFTLFNM